MPEPSSFNHWQQLWLTLNGINAQRMAHGLRGCNPDDRLWQAAQGHSNVMAARQDLDHLYAGDGTPWDRATKAGYRWSQCGEIIADGQTTAAQVVSDWMHSPGHRAEILKPGYTDFGCGISGDPQGILYWTVLFGAPAP